MLVDWLIFALSLCAVATFTCCCDTPCTNGIFGDIGDCCSADPANIDVTIPSDFSDNGFCNQCPSIGGTYTLSPTGGNTVLTCTFPFSSHGYAPGTEYSYVDDDFCTVSGVQYDLLITATITCQGGVCYLIVIVTLHHNSMGANCFWSDWIWRTTFSRNTACDSKTWTLPYIDELDYSNALGGPDAPFCDIAGSPGDITAVGY